MSAGNSSDLHAFYLFLGEQLQVPQNQASPEELLEVWRSRKEEHQVAENVEQGISDYEAGLGNSVKEAFANVRSKLDQAQ